MSAEHRTAQTITIRDHSRNHYWGGVCVCGWFCISVESNRDPPPPLTYWCFLALEVSQMWMILGFTPAKSAKSGYPPPSIWLNMGASFPPWMPNIDVPAPSYNLKISIYLRLYVCKLFKVILLFKMFSFCTYEDILSILNYYVSLNVGQEWMSAPLWILVKSGCPLLGFS